jgi:hypothetical protein
MDYMDYIVLGGKSSSINRWLPEQRASLARRAERGPAPAVEIGGVVAVGEVAAARVSLVVGGLGAAEQCLSSKGSLPRLVPDAGCRGQQ